MSYKSGVEMKKTKDSLSVDEKFIAKYQNHPVLSNETLDEKKTAEFFNQLRLRIREIRKELHITQREFGETAGIDRRYVAKVECGSQNPSFKFLRCISIKHKISMDWLLYGIGEKYIVIDDSAYGSELSQFKKLLDRASSEDIEVVMKMINKII